MRKGIFLSMILLLLVTCITLAADVQVVKVKVQVGNIRISPDVAAEIVVKVNMGTLLESTEKIGNWYKVTVLDKDGKDTIGYIHSTIVEVVSGDTPPPPPPPRAEQQVQPVRQRQPQPQYVAPSDPVAASRGGIRLMGGLSLSNLNISEEIPPEISKGNLTSFTGGLSLAMGSGKVGLEIGCFFAPGGCIIEATDGQDTVKVTVSGSGIMVPVVLRLNLTDGPGPYVLGGGGVGYVLSQKVKITAQGQTQEEDISEDINRIFYGLVFGGGFEFSVNDMILFVEARYNLGLSNMIKEPDEGEYIKAYSILIMGGIRL